MKLRIYGNVKDTKGSQDIIGAKVKLFLNEKEIQQVDSIKNGFFEIFAKFDDSRIEGGQQLMITIEKEGYQPQKHRVFTTEDSFNLDVALEPVAAPAPKKPFNWLPVAIGAGVLCVLLVVSAITWGVISHNNTYTECIRLSDSSGNENVNILAEGDGSTYFNYGNVGIGTTSPQAKLDVSGELMVGGSAADKDVLVVLASAKVFPESDGSQNDWSAKGAFWACPMIYRSQRFPNDGGGTFPDNNYGELILQGTSHGNVYNRGISFVTSPSDSTSPSIKMRINPDGNVGIDTVEPNVLLEIGSRSSSEREVLRVNNDLAGGSFRVFSDDQASNYNVQIDDGYIVQVGTRGGSVSDFKSAMFKGSVHMAIDGGKVGIGTTNPSGTLEVNGSIYQSGQKLTADYVFEPDYKLESIEEHAEFMWDNRHLKAIPKVKVDESGQEIIEVGTHRKGIVEELEKAHIYIEQLYKQNKKLEHQNEALEERLTKLETLLQNSTITE